MKEFFTASVRNMIESEKGKVVKPIIVLMGDARLLDIDTFRNNITDTTTFSQDGDETIFDNDWYVRTITVLKEDSDYHLLSYPQFHYLHSYYSRPELFVDRVIILRDNLRQLFPLHDNDYLEKSAEENIEARPENLPTYQAEQIRFEGHTYYAAKSPDSMFTIIDLFQAVRPLRTTDSKDVDILDITSDMYAIDACVASLITQDRLDRRLAVESHDKHPSILQYRDVLEKLNHVLHQFGGEILLLKPAEIAEVQVVSDRTMELYKRHWPGGDGFKTLPFYKNPDLGRELVYISQGVIVDTIVKEYENACAGKPYRDLYLTAYTGAGKSLLFLLPALHASNSGEVTIVISPLIALMNDQVNGIIQDRGYDKVAYLNSELSLLDRQQVIENCKSGRIDILYMSPEQFLSYDVTHFIGDRRLGLLVIDEAHLITTWGRDFRVDYWHLGIHIWKMRKYKQLRFPLLAVTATAVYGGVNDMVHDTTDSLAMQYPHYFIGQARRDNIEFIVNNHKPPERNADTFKLSQTADFIKGVSAMRIKTIVYVPFRRHIERLLQIVNQDRENVAIGYHGSMRAEDKQVAYTAFRNGEVPVMIATKAFGMGIDIRDIMVVYHHAPSGLLNDYIQEIGRVARIPGSSGYGILNYSNKDQRFTRLLHGMSAILPYQLRLVLKKIHEIHLKEGRKRNMLISSEDFAHIFPNAEDIDQKVSTALMMLEKDYQLKVRFNVLVARPKKLFVMAYAKVSEQDYARLEMSHPGICRFIKNTHGGNIIVQVSLDRFWTGYHSHVSFPKFKKMFYDKQLFRDMNIDFQPMAKLSISIKNNKNDTYDQLRYVLNSIKQAFSELHGYFTEDQLREKLTLLLQNPALAEKMAEFILATFSSTALRPGVIDDDAFLQKRKFDEVNKYIIFGNRYESKFQSILNKLTRLYEHKPGGTAEEYVTNNPLRLNSYLELGKLLDILDLGTYQISGGDNPMIFIRINDPLRIERDSRNPNYENSILSKTLQRFEISNQIFDHFFLHKFSNTERWDFIERYFLGEDMDTLITDFPGEDPTDTDIMEELKKKDLPPVDHDPGMAAQATLHLFPPQSGRTYHLQDRMTLDIDGKPETLKIDEWIRKDPVRLHATLKAEKFCLYRDAYDILMSKLRAEHEEYYKKIMGLKIFIKIRETDTHVRASVPYDIEPLKFYKWWIKDEKKVHMSYAESIILFQRVYMINPRNLLKRHERILRNRGE